ncbi:MAG: DAK2 domain-containing protein [Anaerolineaceae bacterium]|nr:DAK2 domain-containing protein [Anaerolineaceae bacterium]
MATTNTSSVDLVKLFGAVANTLSQNQTALNEADSYNHDHGDNMVQTFEVITQAMKEKKNASAADQLEYAAQILRSKSGSGSSQIYAEGLANAASQFTGQKTISTDNAMQLVQTLLGAASSATQGSGSTGSGDLLGSLLTGLGSAAGSDGSNASSGSGDLLGSLLTGLTGATGGEGTSANTGNTDNSLDLGDILNAGAAFMQTKQSGGSNLDAIVNALVSGSKAGNQDYRAQSGALVANTLIKVISQMATAKK